MYLEIWQDILTKMGYLKPMFALKNLNISEEYLVDFALARSQFSGIKIVIRQSAIFIKGIFYLNIV